MRVYLAGCGWEHLWINENFYDFYRLESFYYLSTREKPVIGKYKSFMLDSGAFTFMNTVKGSLNWDEYVEKYAAFVKENNVKLFYELDIDVIVGIEEVERLRIKLEKIVGRKCIPVWHKSRGLEYWKKMCRDYDYIAIGGIITQEIKRTEYAVFITLLNIAKKENCKVHGLGLTNMEAIKKYKFYSVDSTTWIAGNRFGKIYKFNGTDVKCTDKPIGYRVKTQMTALNNFKEWIKFQKYAEKNL